MKKLFDPDSLTTYAEAIQNWVFETVLVLSTLVQLGTVLVCVAAATVLAPRLLAWIETLGRAPRLMALLKPVFVPLVALVLVWLAFLVAAQNDWPAHLIKIAASLMSAWVVIRLASRLIRNRALAKAVSLIAWVVAALNILALLDPTIALLDSLAFTFGNTRVSMLIFIQGVISLIVLLWVAIGASNILERRFSASPNLTPSVQVLLAKLSKIVLIVIAVFVALDSVGIDLTAFAVFSGALGVGIGFGLQKIFANLVSGVILLLDKSVKPGDVIGVSGTYGWIESLGARYASVVTRDGIEHLIPNEEIITQRVENWSHRDNLVRLKIPIGVSYRCDVRLAIGLCLESAAAIPRVLGEPKPACLMKGFGDSSVDLELRIWIEDPQNGVSNVKSLVLLEVWDRFHEHGIEIPFPQRDLHLRSVFSNQDEAGIELLRDWPGREATGN